MKVQIDTNKKLVKIENNVNLNELFVFLKRVLEDEFVEYSLETNTKIENWNNITYVNYQKPDWYKPLSPFFKTGDNLYNQMVSRTVPSTGVTNYDVKNNLKS